MSTASNPAVNLVTVLAEEAEELNQLCKLREGSLADLSLAAENDAIGASDSFPARLGVAFSGGGIRSASVNLGLIQALARCKLLQKNRPGSDLLRQVHYLSGISGGGYILGWLTAWIAREDFDKVQPKLEHNTADGQPPPDRNASQPYRFLEPHPLRFLRQYASYLTPRVGLASGDTLALIAVYMRNLLLNQTLMVAGAGVVMAALQMLAPWVFWTGPMPWWLLYSMIVVTAAAGIVAGYETGKSLGCLARQQQRDTSGRARGLLVLSAIGLWWLLPTALGHLGWASAVGGVGFWVALICAFAVIGFRSVQGEVTLKPVNQNKANLAWGLATIVAAFFFALLTFGISKWLVDADHVVISDWYVALGVPAVLLAFALTSYVHIGIFGNAMPDAEREWLARFAGFLLFFAAMIAGVMLIALRAPMWMHLLFRGLGAHSGGISWLKWILPGGWLFTVLSGLLAARSDKTGGPNQKTKLDILMKVAPPLFLVGVLLLISWGVHALAFQFDSGEYLYWGEWERRVENPASSLAPSIQARYDHRPAKHPPRQEQGGDVLYNPAPWQSLRVLLSICAVHLAIMMLLGARLDVNEFSMHLLYRNRLVRAFLGASNNGTRPANPFTGFAVNDDVPFQDLCTRSEHCYTKSSHRYNGPYPLWGTALNLTSGEDLAWQKRKAASFIYSPLYCGWDYVPPRPADPTEGPHCDDATGASHSLSNYGYRGTGKYTQGRMGQPSTTRQPYTGLGCGPSLGTAMAASGAALSPNQGYHSSPAVAALLAAFNVRIGWWTGNPRSASGWDKYAPKPHYLLKEIGGSTGDKGEFVYLSDGGHFENLGIYELVRRRVKFIIACDADADPSYDFGDLGNAIEKCRRDFGVNITMQGVRRIRPSKSSGLSSGHYAVGSIKYLRPCSGTHDTHGVLLYIKSSLVGDEPADVLSMRAANPAFPHDSTANQFFNESQFEAYRALGEHMFTSIWTAFQQSPEFKPWSSESEDQAAKSHQIRERIDHFFNQYLRNSL